VCAIVLMGQAGTGRTVEAERFILRDQGGETLAQLGVDASGTPGLTFYDKQENDSGPLQSSIFLFDALQPGKNSAQFNSLFRHVSLRATGCDSTLN
jgi:hypothetical protein